jgi:hypothetical protein
VSRATDARLRRIRDGENADDREDTEVDDDNSRSAASSDADDDNIFA